VICHGSSSRQALAISEAIEEQLFADGRRKPKHVEGRRVADWILMDFIDIVVHVFVDEKREFYGLERLWGDAPRVDIHGTMDTRSRPARRRPSVSR
jgi:ribosome-associated protein